MQLRRALVLANAVAQHADDMLIEFGRNNGLWSGDGIACHESTP